MAKQNPEGPIIELPKSKHDLGNKKMHPFGNQKGKDMAYYHTHGAYDSI